MVDYDQHSPASATKDCARTTRRGRLEFWLKSLAVIELGRYYLRGLKMIPPPRPKVKGMLKVGALLALVAFILFGWANVRPVPIRVQVTYTSFGKPNHLWYNTKQGVTP